MILTPFSGPTALSSDRFHFVDGRSGLITSYSPRSEGLIPAHIPVWVENGAVGSRLTAQADSTFGDQRALRARYPAQSCAPGDRYKGDTPETAALAGQLRPDGGMHYLHRIPRSDHARLTYAVRFPIGFDWRGGGKLPGLNSRTMAASGGVTDPTIAGVTSWTGRFMWRPGGRFTPYVYMADNRDPRWAGSAQWDPGAEPTSPNFTGSTCFSSFDSFVTPGSWNVVTQEIRMNTPGETDGWLIASIDDLVIVDRRDIMWRRNDSLHIDAVFMSSFFGGNTFANGDASIWFTPVEQTVDFSDMYIQYF